MSPALAGRFLTTAPPGKSGRFLIMVSISLLVIGLFIFPNSSCFSLGKLYFRRICPFPCGCPFYWHIVFCSSLIILCISAVSVVISPFSFLILLICILSLLFLMRLAKGLSILFIFSKILDFSFIDFCYCFLHFYFIYFCSDLYDFFPSTDFGFSLFFFL